MDDAERQRARESLDRWKRVGPELEAICRRELRAYDFERNRAIVASLFEMGVTHAVPRVSSGLIEWNRRLGIAKR